MESPQPPTHKGFKTTGEVIAGVVLLVAVIIGGSFVLRRPVEDQRNAISVFVDHSHDMTTEDGTSTWQTYRNTDYGFEFQYPLGKINNKEWVFKDRGPSADGGIYVNLSIANKSEWGDVAVTVIPNEGHETVAHWLERNKDQIQDAREVTYNGAHGVEYDLIEFDGNVLSHYVTFIDRWYFVHFYDDNPDHEMFKKIISSFKFTIEE